MYVSGALCIIILRSQGSDYSVFIFSAYTDACTSSCKIVVASKRPLITIRTDLKSVNNFFISFQALKRKKTHASVIGSAYVMQKGRALSSSSKTGFPFPRKVHGKDGRREKYLSGVYKTKFWRTQEIFQLPRP